VFVNIGAGVLLGVKVLLLFELVCCQQRVVMGWSSGVVVSDMVLGMDGLGLEGGGCDV
jgi:hypothetical protein